MPDGKPYYVLKNGMYLRIAVLPVVLFDEFTQALDEIRAGLALEEKAQKWINEKGQKNDS